MVLVFEIETVIDQTDTVLHETDTTGMVTGIAYCCTLLSVTDLS